MNTRWHERHPLPRGASLGERVAWHVAHQKTCACRPMPASVLTVLKTTRPQGKPQSPPLKAKPARGTLKRAIVPMPAEVRNALVSCGLMGAYQARPPYQQNDYLGWMARARLAPTRQKRLDQMLAELERGGVYMKMKWAPPARPPGASRRASARGRRTAR